MIDPTIGSWRPAWSHLQSCSGWRPSCCLDEELFDRDARHEDPTTEPDRRDLVAANEVVGEGTGDSEQFGSLCDAQHGARGALNRRPVPVARRVETVGSRESFGQACRDDVGERRPPPFPPGSPEDAPISRSPRAGGLRPTVGGS